MGEPERLLWQQLRASQLCGVKVRRQYSVGPYVLDFYVPALKLAVEIDGDSHYVTGAERRDRERQTYIESFGIRFLRFTNQDVSTNLEGVLDRIIGELHATSPDPSLVRRGTGPAPQSPTGA